MASSESGSEADGKRLTHSRVKDLVPGTCRRAGLAKRLTTHGLRNTEPPRDLRRPVYWSPAPMAGDS